MNTEPSLFSRFLARLLADSVADSSDELAEEHVKNDARLARGESLGLVIAEELRRVEIERDGRPTS